MSGVSCSTSGNNSSNSSSEGISSTHEEFLTPVEPLFGRGVSSTEGVPHLFGIWRCLLSTSRDLRDKSSALRSQKSVQPWIVILVCTCLHIILLDVPRCDARAQSLHPLRDVQGPNQWAGPAGSWVRWSHTSCHKQQVATTRKGLDVQMRG